MNNYILHDLCKKCKLCIETCPINMIGIDSRGQVNFLPEREEICLQCGQCMAICPSDAITNAKSYYKSKFTELPENKVSYNLFVNFLSTRRSVRNFKNKAVDRECINKITNALKYVPYGAAPEKMKVTVVNNRDIIEKALPYTEKFLDDVVRWVDNPLMSAIIRHKKGQETFNTIKNHLYPMSKLENYKLEYGDRITRGAPAMMIFHAHKGAEEHTHNALINATYIMLTIHSLGMGATMNGIIPAAINKVKAVRNIFEIPNEDEAVIAIIFGYPKYKYQKAISRYNTKVYYRE